jgi:hypothetical protein
MRACKTQGNWIARYQSLEVGDWAMSGCSF